MNTPNPTQSVAIGSDHAGFERKQQIIVSLQNQGYEVIDFGTHDEHSVDYPDYVHPLALHLQAHPDTKGILVCGSGQGVCMTANKYAHIRAALVWIPEIAEMTRKHNNANVLCLPGRYVSEALALACVEKFLNTDFEGGRHQNRIDKMNPDTV
jgi:ribose 5-phosphate isomerase B